MPRISTPLLSGLLVAVGLAAVPALHAQSAQRFSIQGSGLFVGLSGDAYDGMNAGPGAEIQLRYTPGLWSFGLGYQYSTHGVDNDAFDNDVSLSGAFFEPRRTFDVGSTSYAPYASARLAVLKEAIDFDADGTSYSASATGTQINVGGGVLFRISPRVNLDLGATFGVINFGDVEVNVPGFGTVVAGEGGSGQNFVLRAGIAVGL